MRKVLFAILCLVCAGNGFAQVGLELDGTDVRVEPTGAVSLVFEEKEGCYLLCENDMSGKQYKGFRVEFEEPLSEEGLTLVANNVKYELEVGTSVVEGEFLPIFDVDESLILEKGPGFDWKVNRRRLYLQYHGDKSLISVKVKDVIFLLDDGGEYCPFYSEEFAGFNIEWDDVDGIEHHLTVAGNINSHVTLTDMPEKGRVIFHSRDARLGGQSWNGKKIEATVKYQATFRNPVPNADFEWVVVRADGMESHFGIDAGSTVSIVELHSDVLSCGIRYNGDVHGEKENCLCVESVCLYGADVIPLSVEEMPYEEQQSEFFYDLRGIPSKHPHPGLNIVKGKGNRKTVIKRY